MYGLLARRNVLTMILAGGMGERLYPLTRDRAKPAVPFGGRYRIIDFVINNFINSGFLKIKVLTQFKSNSLIEHITRTWRLVPEIGQYVDVVLASMGNYIFKASVMIDVLQRNALRDAAHDFGKEIIPDMYSRMKVYAYDFAKNRVPGEAERNRGYWRDVGTIDSYFAACLDLVSVTPAFNLYNAMWPLVSAPNNLPPAKF